MKEVTVDLFDVEEAAGELTDSDIEVLDLLEAFTERLTRSQLNWPRTTGVGLGVLRLPSRRAYTYLRSSGTASFFPRMMQYCQERTSLQFSTCQFLYVGRKLQRMAKRPITSGLQRKIVALRLT